MKHLLTLVLSFVSIWSLNAQTVTVLREQASTTVIPGFQNSDEYGDWGITPSDQSPYLLVSSNKANVYCSVWMEGLSVKARSKDMVTGLDIEVIVYTYPDILAFPPWAGYSNHYKVYHPYKIAMSSDRIVIAVLKNSDWEHYSCEIFTYDLLLNTINSIDIQDIVSYTGVIEEKGSDYNIAINSNNQLSVLYRDNFNGTKRLRIKKYDAAGMQIDNDIVEYPIDLLSGYHYLEDVDVDNNNNYVMAFVSKKGDDIGAQQHWITIQKLNSDGYVFGEGLQGEDDGVNWVPSPGEYPNSFFTSNVEVEFLEQSLGGINTPEFIATCSGMYEAPRGPNVPEDQPPVHDYFPGYTLYVFNAEGNLVNIDPIDQDITLPDFYNGNTIANSMAVVVGDETSAIVPFSISSSVTENNNLQVAIGTDHGYFTGLFDITGTDATLYNDYVDYKFHQGIFGKNVLSTASLGDCRNVTVGYSDLDPALYGPRETDVFSLSTHTFKKSTRGEFDNFTYHNDDEVTTSATNQLITFEGFAVHIKSSLTFTNCTLSFAPETRLVVRNNATVTFEGCTLDIVQTCGGTMWRGIEVEKGSTVNFYNSSLSNARWGISTASTDPPSEDADGFWSTSWPDEAFDQTTKGGNIHANNSSFTNNAVSLFYWGMPNNLSGNLVESCNFLQDAPLRDRIVNHDGMRRSFITAFGHKSPLRIYGNGFTSGSAELDNITHHGYGVELCDTRAYIQDHPTLPSQGTFSGCNSGVTSYVSTNTPNNTFVDGCDFTNNRNGVVLHGGVNYSVQRNNFYSAGALGMPSRAIKLWGAQRSVVRSNYIKKHWLGVYAEDTDPGMVEAYETRITDNTITENRTGVSTFGHCENTEINCNTFSEQTNSNWYHYARIKDQGDCSGDPARNQFIDQPTYKDIYVADNTNTDHKFEYFYEDQGLGSYSIPVILHAITSSANVQSFPCSGPPSSVTTECNPINSHINSSDKIRLLEIAISNDDPEHVRSLTYELLSYYMDSNLIDSCSWLLDQVPYNFARFERFGFHIQADEFVEASALLNSIVPDNSLEELTLNYYRKVLEIYTQATFNFHLTVSQLQTIDDMASKGGTRYDKMGLNYAAKSFLIFLTGKDYKTRKENYDGESERRDEAKWETGIGLFPNPSEGILTIEHNGESAYLNLVDVTGKIVFGQYVFSGEMLNLSHLPNGVYTAQLDYGNAVERIKWVKL